MKILRRDLDQAVAAGWVDQGSASSLLGRLTNIDSTLAGMKLIDPAMQKQVDQVAGDFFRLQFGAPGHVDSGKVMRSAKAPMRRRPGGSILRRRCVWPSRRPRSHAPETWPSS